MDEEAETVGWWMEDTRSVGTCGGFCGEVVVTVVGKEEPLEGLEVESLGGKVVVGI